MEMQIQNFAIPCLHIGDIYKKHMLIYSPPKKIGTLH